AHRPPRPLHAGAPGHVELFLGDRLQRAARAEAMRVVHQDVDRSVATHALLHHRLDVAALADVDDGRHAVATFGPDLLGRALGAVELDFRDAHPGPLAREHQRDGAADALARTRDDGDLALEAAHS